MQKDGSEMSDNKQSKRRENIEEIHRREKRLRRRENTILLTKRRRKWRLEYAEKQAADIAATSRLLKKDRNKERPGDKRSGSQKFLEAFSFIGCTPFDKRYRIPPDYRTPSFNENRQYMDFFKSFIYPYSLSPPLLFTPLQNEHFTDERGKRKKSQYYEIIKLSKKWLCDIVNGESFYKRNKSHFTRGEAHYFLNTYLPYTGPLSVIELYFYAKCKARNMGVKRCTVITKVFTQKFENYFDHEIVAGFIDLLARDNEYPVEGGELGDICDFINAKIDEYEKERRRNSPFSFSGRTMISVAGLANEWHADIQREQEALNALANAGQFQQRGNSTHKLTLATHWTGINVPNFQYKTDKYKCVWTVTQLLSARNLLNEGRKMKSCVASYASSCLKGQSAIFNISRFYEDLQLTESMATLEVTHDRFLVQAKAKCNGKVCSPTMNIITRWARTNRIKMGLV
jgi:hypothetical protein